MYQQLSEEIHNMKEEKKECDEADRQPTIARFTIDLHGIVTQVKEFVFASSSTIKEEVFW